MEANKEIFLAISAKDTKYIKFIRETISKYPMFNIEREFSYGQQLIDALPYLKSTVILIENELIEMSGLTCIKQMNLTDFNVRALLVVDNGNYENILQAVRLGAYGYIAKSLSSEKFVDIIDDVHNGGGKMSHLLINKIIEFMEDALLIFSEAKFSSREKQIIGYLHKGMSCKEIASRLFLSPATIRTHIRNIRSKQNSRI